MTRDTKDNRTADLLAPDQVDRRKVSDAFFGAVLDAMPRSSRIVVSAQAKALWTNKTLQVYRNGRMVTIDNPHYLGASIKGIADTVKEMKP